MWNKKGLPHKGWTCIDVTDTGDAESTCEMCENSEVRYIHTMQHPDVPETIEVGCICAEKLEDSYQPRLRERKLRNRALRRLRWLKRKWRTSHRGNSYLNYKGQNIGVYYDTKIGAHGYRIEGHFSKERFIKEDEAKLALFDALNERN